MKFIDCRPTWGVIAGMEAVCPAGTSSITRRICKPSSLIGLTELSPGRQLILNKALKKAVVQDGRYAWQLFRSVLRAWDGTLKRFWRFLRYLPVLGLKGGTGVEGRRRLAS